MSSRTQTLDSKFLSASEKQQLCDSSLEIIEFENYTATIEYDSKTSDKCEFDFRPLVKKFKPPSCRVTSAPLKTVCVEIAKYDIKESAAYQVDAYELDDVWDPAPTVASETFPSASDVFLIPIAYGGDNSSSFGDSAVFTSKPELGASLWRKNVECSRELTAAVPLVGSGSSPCRSDDEDSDVPLSDLCGGIAESGSPSRTMTSVSGMQSDPFSICDCSSGRSVVESKYFRSVPIAATAAATSSSSSSMLEEW